MTFRRLIATAAAAVTLSVPLGLQAADAPNDSFIAGYAAAVLEHELLIPADTVSVTGGHVTYTGPAMSSDRRAQLVKLLSSIPGVKDVTVNEQGEASTEAPTPAARPVEKVAVTSAKPAASSKSPDAATADSSETKLTTDNTPLSLYLGIGRTFSPLMADPKWPHFFASYNHYTRDKADTNLSDVADVGFGETISLIKQSYPSGFRWEAGVQGGLFAIFDTDSDSKDLINADYFVGPYVALRQDKFSLMARVFHQSSHLGDEYLLRSEHETRQNFSFETVNLLASYDLPAGFRVYAGGGYLFDVDPSGFDPWNIQYGVEWISPTTLANTGWIRPVAALDVQNRQESDWAFSFSLRAGVQLEDPARFDQRLQLMFEFYDGNSFNGQFYDDHIRYYGMGVHFFF